MELIDSDQLKYLANVIYVAHIDGALSYRETATIEEIRASLGAKKGTLKAAVRAVEAGGYVPSPVGDFPTRVAGLADMLYVGVVDGDLSDTEREAIQRFSAAAGVTSEQVEMMVREAITRAERIGPTMSCTKCSATIAQTVKFCPNCGNALEVPPTDSVALSLDIPATGYAIEFCESSAAGFPAALEYSKSAPSFASCLRAKKTWYLAGWPEESFLEVTALAQLLSGIRNRKCYHNGSELPWDELFGFAWCARNRDQAYRSIEYCFGKDENRVNPWGCKQAQLDWTEWAPWFSYGQFKRAGLLKSSQVWHFDKARIRHELMTNLHRVRYCPYLRTSLIDCVLRAIPDVVEVPARGAWKFSESHEEVPGSIKIVEVEQSGEFQFKNEYYADGVRPVGLQVLRDVLRRAFAEAGIGDVSADELTT